MKIFNLDKVYSVVCNFKNTQYGFKHVATLCKSGLQIYETKICYYNRTWERFEYESILNKVVDYNFDGAEKQKYLAIVKTMQ